MSPVTKGLAAGPVQKGIYDVLSSVGATALRSLIESRVFDAVPQGVTEAYVVIGAITEVSDDTLEDGDTGIGSELLVTIDAVTDDARAGAGFKAVQAIASEVKLLLHDQVFAVEGWTLVSCEHEDTTYLLDQDEGGRPKRHSSSTYRVRVEA